MRRPDRPEGVGLGRQSRFAQRHRPGFPAQAAGVRRDARQLRVAHVALSAGPRVWSRVVIGPVDRARSSRPPHRIRAVWPVVVAVAVAAAVLAIAARGSRPATRDSGAGQHARAAGPPLRVRRSKLGPILTDRHGRTLYLFLEDRRGKSTCYGVCARVWPPAIATAPLTVDAKVLPGT